MLHSLLIVKNKFDTSDKNDLEINRKLECVLFWINFKKNEGWEVGVVSSLFFFFDELETLLKKGKTELQGPPGLFQNDGRETRRAIPKIKRTKEITRKRPFC